MASRELLGSTGDGLVGRVRALVRDVLNAHTSPARTAASLALGLGVGLSPLLGLHTLLILALAFLLGLNRVAAVSASCIFNPWTAVPIVAVQLRVGALLLGHDRALPSLSRGASVAWIRSEVTPFLLDYVVGAGLLAVVAGAAAYPVLLVLIRAYRRRRGA